MMPRGLTNQIPNRSNIFSKVDLFFIVKTGPAVHPYP